MSLPQQYTSVEAYFKDVLIYLKNNYWMYNFPNTHIKLNTCLDHIMDEWIEYSRTLGIVQIKNLATGLVSDDCPKSLSCLLLEIVELKPTQPMDNITNVVVGKRKNVNPKKMHEIVEFANFVNCSTAERSIQYFVDVGTGLGYLPQYLFEQYGFKVLGIESSEKNVQTAISVQQQLYPESQDFVKYKQMFITRTSALELFNSLLDSFPEFKPETDSFGITGLHACADLGVNMLHLFKSISCASCLFLMPCCYHRIEMKKNESNIEREECFENFPFSNTLKELFVQFDASMFLRRPFLRLAAQQANSWTKLYDTDINVMMENCLFRAVLQELCEADHLQISRKKRKTGCTKSFSIQAAVSKLDQNFSFRYVQEPSSPVCIDTLKGRVLNSYLACHKRDLPAIELLCVFQNVLQGLCENVVLLDRVQHMRELGFASCRVIKITNQHISPRCQTIVAFK